MLMAENLTILIVDDSEAMRTMIKHMLESAGYLNIIEADDGYSALKILKTQQVDLIFSDWNMYGMTGIELLKKVREDSNIPFIMLSVEGGAVSVNKAIEYGANDFISKPFKKDVLIGTVEKVLGGKT
jgi:two-component system chemotaxis response regulator CheY